MAIRTLNLKQSSNISGAAWDDETLGLTVTFHSKHSGTYQGVTGDIVDAFESADSPGNYLHTYIKNSYPYSKVS